MTLSDSLLRKLKPQASPYKTPRELGLYGIVNPNGSILWRFSYRHNGKENALAIGRYPEITLKRARERRDEARRLIAEGMDPSAERKADKERKAAEAANTFRTLVEEWLQVKAGKLAAVTHNKARWMLELAYPTLGDMPLSEIRPRDVLKAIRAVEARDRLDTAHRLKARISEVFRYAIALDDGRATSDPCRDLKGALKPRHPVRHHAALTEPKAVGELMRAIYAYHGAAETRAALKLAPLVFVRPGELRAALWSQFDLDGEEPLWRFFSSKTKVNHIVPLCTQAVEILRDLEPITGRGVPAWPNAPRYVFPNVRTRFKPMSENALTAALRGMGYTGDQMTWHGFRAMARTLLAELGWNPDAIERQLAHKPGGPLGAAYDRAQFLAERRRMMQAWADYLDELRRGTVGRREFSKAA